MKTILIITGIFPPDIGGPATYVPQIANALVSKGNQVTVITYSDYINHLDNIYKFKIIRLPRKSNKIKRFALTIKTIISFGKKADLLFVNGLALETAIANKIIKKPIIQKIVGDIAWERSRNKGWVSETFEEFQTKRYNLAIATLKRLRSWSSQEMDHIIVPSQYLGCIVEHWGIPREKITIIYNALEIPEKLPTVTIPLKTTIKIITVSRLIPWKHIDRIIEVVSKLDDVGLVIVGDGNLRSPLENQVKNLMIEDRVYFAGKRSKVETLSLMANCDIFVLNSSYEGLPHVVLEATSMGLPVIATEVGGTPEVIKHGENGFLIPLKNNEALSNIIKHLISHPKLFKSDNNQYILEKFSYKNMIKCTEDILTK